MTSSLRIDQVDRNHQLYELDYLIIDTVNQIFHVGKSKNLFILSRDIYFTKYDLLIHNTNSNNAINSHDTEIPSVIIYYGT